MENSLKNAFVRKSKTEKWTEEEKEKLWRFHLANKHLSCIQLAKTVKGFFLNRTEEALIAMIYILKKERNLPGQEVDDEIVYETGRPSLIKIHNLSEKEVRMIVLEWYTNGMFADTLQDEQGRDLEEILEVDSDTSAELLEKALSLITALKESADEQTKKAIEALFREVKYTDYINQETADYESEVLAQNFDKFGKNKR
jgi:hypothetical protein